MEKKKTVAVKSKESEAGGILSVLSSYTPLVLLLTVFVVFMVLLVRKGQMEATTNDIAVPLGVLFIVVTVVYLHPGVQKKVQMWVLMRREEKERQFWQGRAKKDKRQAEAQERMAEERRLRQEARQKKSE